MDILAGIRNLMTAALFSAALLLPGAAEGQQHSAREIPRWSITPSGGYTFGGEFEDETAADAAELEDAAHFGLIFNLRESLNTQWEVFYARQGTDAGLAGAQRADLDIQYLQAGGTYVADGDSARPFLAATLGVTRFDPGPLTFESENFLSFSVGAGWQWQPAERFGLRLEGRLLGTFLHSDTALFCSTGPEENVCAIAADSDMFWQFQTTLGLMLGF